MGSARVTPQRGQARSTRAKAPVRGRRTPADAAAASESTLAAGTEDSQGGRTGGNPVKPDSRDGTPMPGAEDRRGNVAVARCRPTVTWTATRAG